MTCVRLSRKNNAPIAKSGALSVIRKHISVSIYRSIGDPMQPNFEPGRDSNIDSGPALYF
jgi:hypothetical protein